MRTKKVRISDEEREFQIRLDGVVRAYEQRIHEMISVRDELRKIRKCQYCGGRYYANGLCVNCYNLMRQTGEDREEFMKRRKRYGYRQKKPENWMVSFWGAMNKDVPLPQTGAELEKWCNDFINLLGDEDKTIVNLIYKDGWSLRGCADILGLDRARIMSRVTSIKTTAKRIWKSDNKKKESMES